VPAEGVGADEALVVVVGDPEGSAVAESGLEIRRTDLHLDVTKSAVALASLAYDQVKTMANRVCQ